MLRMASVDTAMGFTRARGVPEAALGVYVYMRYAVWSQARCTMQGEGDAPFSSAWRALWRNMKQGQGGKGKGKHLHIRH